MKNIDPYVFLRQTHASPHNAEPFTHAKFSTRVDVPGHSMFGGNLALQEICVGLTLGIMAGYGTHVVLDGQDRLVREWFRVNAEERAAARAVLYSELEAEIAAEKAAK